MNIFAERIKELRILSGLSQGKLGLQVGLSKHGISKIESGKNATSLYHAVKLADFFGVSIDYLVGRTDEPEINKKV
jgi:transcriptional regulator with XRE-family HTH domain